MTDKLVFRDGYLAGLERAARVCDLMEGTHPRPMYQNAAAMLAMHIRRADQDIPVPIEGIEAERLAMIDAIIYGKTPLERFQRNQHVRNYEQLLSWAKHELRTTLLLRAHRETKEGPADGVTEDYLVGKQGVLSALLSNLRQIREEEGLDVLDV